MRDTRHYTPEERERYLDGYKDACEDMGRPAKVDFWSQYPEQRARVADLLIAPSTPDPVLLAILSALQHANELLGRLAEMFEQAYSPHGIEASEDNEAESTSWNIRNEGERT